MKLLSTKYFYWRQFKKLLLVMSVYTQEMESQNSFIHLRELFYKGDLHTFVDSYIKILLHNPFKN